ncbi:hypothetical protein [Verrucosispora sioxanthis]|uniref:hypothetical protein n=1 Tax=Verrucosispora sioxanthis TaxID=2499994 RepID=UPI00209F76A5|nr:hypothetical protein [Verrucosispora sioxanthis]
MDSRADARTGRREPGRDWRDTVSDAADLALLGILTVLAAAPVLTAGAAIGTPARPCTTGSPPAVGRPHGVRCRASDGDCCRAYRPANWAALAGTALVVVLLGVLVTPVAVPILAGYALAAVHAVARRRHVTRVELS